MPSLEQVLAADLDRSRTVYVSAVLDRVRGELPVLVADEDRARLAATGTDALLREFAEVLRLGLDRGYHAPPAALAYLERLAREGLSLATVLRSYRLGQEAVFQRAADLVKETDERDPGAAVSRIAMLSFRFTDAVMDEIADAFEHEREARIRSAAARRDAVLDALLAGRAVDRQEAERVLGRRLDGAHLAIVAWVDPAGPVLTRVDRTGTATAWITPADGAGFDAARLADPRVRLALGEVGHGPTGFARTKHQADIARRLADQAGLDGPTAYRDVALAALLTRDPEAAQRFAAEELGALAGSGGAELLRTLAAYFAAGHDQTRTAAALGVHRNTIARRLERAETLLGGPIDRRARERAAALLILATRPPVGEP
jgi:DNA-binding PucR family transcriptional regulator